MCFSLCKGSHLFFKVQSHFYSLCVIRKSALTKPASKISPGQEEFPYMKSTKTLNTEHCMDKTWAGTPHFQ